MRFPLEYTKQGKFKLHSGQESSIFYDVNSLLTDNDYLERIIASIPFCEHYIGIATGGAIIAGVVSRERRARYSMIKDQELKGEMPKGQWILIDDVVTTGRSLTDALNIVGKNPDQTWVVLDRRARNEDPEVYSIFNI